LRTRKIFSPVPASSESDRERTPLIRDVTPPGVVRVFRSGEPPGTIPREVHWFENVRVDQNANLKAGSTSFKFYGLVLPLRQKICTSATGARWACGNRALIALRNLVDTRTVACAFKDEGKSAVCWVERTDITLWMLQEGWAELAAGISDKAYIAATKLAQVRKVGLWADGPPPVR
jgi:endonuclease YncB( thermonuclease family)